VDEARAKAVESRLTPYFQSDVAPRLRDCWSRVKGEGQIAVALTYTRAEHGWTWDTLKVTSSTLPAEQDAVASQCLTESLRTTYFPVDQTDTDFGTSAPAATFVINWSFPVPLADAAVAMARSTGGGPGSPASCWYCGFDRQGEPACQAGRSGWEGCIETDSGGCICFGGSCGSGGFLGTGGGLILMRDSAPPPDQSGTPGATRPAAPR
jgi:hypothetical protein